ncbi:MAG: Flavobacterium phage vB FspS hattifnatt9 [Bacteroidota bacterium]|jgi:hypothetical protein
MDLHLIKTLNGSFKLAYDSDYEKAKQIPLNEPFKVVYTKQRNARFHRKFFSLINLCYQNQETFNNIEHLRKELIICAGHYELIFNLESGTQKKEALSISFSKMDETEFNKLYSDVLNVICDKFLFDKNEILENVQQYF